MLKYKETAIKCNMKRTFVCCFFEKKIPLLPSETKKILFIIQSLNKIFLFFVISFSLKMKIMNTKKYSNYSAKHEKLFKRNINILKIWFISDFSMECEGKILIWNIWTTIPSDTSMIRFLCDPGLKICLENTICKNFTIT